MAPGQPSQVVEQAGPGPAEQQASLFAKQEEMKRELRDFLQAHTKIATKYNFVSQTEEHKTYFDRLEKMAKAMNMYRNLDLKNAREARMLSRLL